MNTKATIEKSDGVLRDAIKEYRDGYFVEYLPADATLPFACIQLTFLEKTPETAVRRLMEIELEHWLKRFPVPVMVSAFDVKGDLLHLAEAFGESSLMGYCEPLTGKTVQRWGLLKQDEMPTDQSTVEHLAHVYNGVPYRRQSDIRQKVMRGSAHHRNSYPTNRFLDGWSTGIDRNG